MRKDPTRAMKILWKPVEDVAKVMDENHFSHEHLVFPPHVYTTLKSTLENSQFLLPLSARKFQEWNVGLLQRFSWEDVSGSDAKVVPPSQQQQPQSYQASNTAGPDSHSDDEEEDTEERIRKIFGSEALLE